MDDQDDRAASVEVEARLREQLGEALERAARYQQHYTEVRRERDAAMVRLDERNQLLQAAVMILDDEELQSRLLRDDAALCRNLVRRINDLDKGPVR